MSALQVYYRPDEYPEWIPWQNFAPQQFALIGNPGAIGANGLPSARAGFIPRLTLPKPENTIDPTTKRRTRRGYQFQVKFVWSGHLVIDRFRLHAQKLIEDSKAKIT